MEALGPNHMDVAATLNNLAVSLKGQPGVCGRCRVTSKSSLLMYCTFGGSLCSNTQPCAVNQQADFCGGANDLEYFVSRKLSKLIAFCSSLEFLGE